MTEIDIYFKFLISLVKADGKVEPEERDFILNSAASLGLEDDALEKFKLDISSHEIDLPSLYEVIHNTNDPSFIINLLKDGYALAKSDGAVDSAELDVLKGVVTGFPNYSDDLFDELVDWCEESLYIKQFGSDLLSKLMVK
ncbi:TPA: hypothetical protein I7194_02880 [Vibrio vulnificus]|nr:hypothetical protein [Vibrio vulnificus]